MQPDAVQRLMQPGDAKQGFRTKPDLTRTRMTEHHNQHGRKPGRGLRPWLLIPKILAVAVVFGGFVAVAVLLHTRATDNLDQWKSLIDAVRRIFRFAIVPGVLLIVLLGVLLLLQHPRVFLRMRWMQLKIVLILGLPVLHLRARTLLHDIVAELDSGRTQHLEAHMAAFTLTCDVTILLLALLIFFGRYKPRLGWKATR